MKRANRILLIVTQADWGGVQMFLVNFAAGLIKEGRTVLLAAGGEGELWAEARKHGIPTRRLAHVRREINPLEDWRAIGEIKRLIREFKPDAIHLNSSKMGVLGSLACAAVHGSRFTDHGSWIRTVYRIGGWAFLEPLPTWKKWVYRTAETYTAKYKDVIITVHPGDEALARALGISPRKKLLTVPNGLDIAGFISRLLTVHGSRQTLGIPDHAFVFGTVANAYATKGLLPYLDVLQKVLSRNTNVLAVIVGDGPELNRLTAHRSRLGLDRLVLTGHRDDAATLYPAFDVFVLPSRKEGMPWTLLEAMASGVPSIATDVGACRWMLADPHHALAGIIVPPNDPLSLAEAMQRLLHSTEEREALSKGARSNVAARFSWEATYAGNRDALDGE